MLRRGQCCGCQAARTNSRAAYASFATLHNNLALHLVRRICRHGRMKATRSFALVAGQGFFDSWAGGFQATQAGFGTGSRVSWYVMFMMLESPTIAELCSYNRGGEALIESCVGLLESIATGVLRALRQYGRAPLPLEAVEPASEIVKRFRTGRTWIFGMLRPQLSRQAGAMSYGSISMEVRIHFSQCVAEGFMSCFHLRGPQHTRHRIESPWWILKHRRGWRRSG